MTELIRAAGGQVGRTRGADTQEQRQRRLYRTVFSKALNVYEQLRPLYENIISEVLGQVDETGNMGIPNATRMYPKVLAGAYYILYLLNITSNFPSKRELEMIINDMFDEQSKRTEAIGILNSGYSNQLSNLFVEIALYKMKIRRPHIQSSITITPERLNKIIDNVMVPSSREHRSKEEITAAYQIDIFTYAMKIVTFRSRRFEG